MLGVAGTGTIARHHLVPEQKRTVPRHRKVPFPPAACFARPPRHPAAKQLSSPLIFFLVSPWWGGTSTSCLLGDCTNASGEVFARGEQQAVCLQWQLEVAGVEGEKTPPSVHVSTRSALPVHLPQPPLSSHCAVKARSHHTGSGYNFICILYAL